MNLTWIYLISDHDSGCYKIGKSDDPNRRLKQLKAQSTLLAREHRFYLIEAWLAKPGCETELHFRFAIKRKRGEWFEINGDDIEEIYRYFSDRPKLFTGRSDDDEAADATRWLTETEKYPVHEISSIAGADNAGFLDFAVEGFGYEI